MTWAILTSAVGAGHATLDTTGADMFIGGVGWDSSPASTDLHDDAGNGVGSYQRASFSDNAAAASIYYIRHPSTSASTKITANPDSGAEAVIFSAWTGVNFPLQSAGANSVNTQVTTITPSVALTPTSANQLAIFCMGARMDNTITPSSVVVDSGFTKIGTTGVQYTGSLWYLINPPLSALQPICTWSGANAAACTLTIFGPSFPASAAEIQTRNGLQVYPTSVVASINSLTFAAADKMDGFKLHGTAVSILTADDYLVGANQFIGMDSALSHGSINPAILNGATIAVCKYQKTGTNALTFAVSGTFAQNFFNSLSVNDSTPYLTSGANTFSTAGGLTTWVWNTSTTLLQAGDYPVQLT